MVEVSHYSSYNFRYNIAHYMWCAITRIMSNKIPYVFLVMLQMRWELLFLILERTRVGLALQARIHQR